MASIYSQLLSEGFIGGGGPTQAFYAPAGFVWVLRDVDVWCNANVAGGNFYLQSTFTGNSFWQFAPTSGGGPQFSQWRGRQVFYSVDSSHLIGFQIATDSTGSTGFAWRACGYLLSP